MKDIKGLGFTIPTEDDSFINLDSLNSLSEADIVIMNPSFGSTNYSTYDGSFSESKHNGKPCYNHDSSSKILEHYKHWQQEIKSYLNSGKTLFIVLTEKKNFYIQTGKKEYSGTGKNRQVTNLVSEFSNYKFLPKIDSVEYYVAHGTVINSNDPIFKNLLDKFSDFMSYETYLIIESQFKAGFTTKNKDKVLGGVFNVLGGNIVLLPKINFDKKEFTEYIKKESYWTEEAIRVGKQFSQALIEIDEILRKITNKTPKPDWLTKPEYTLKGSTLIATEINKVQNEVAQLNDRIEKLNEDLVESEKLNDLLFESGKPLESAVTYALQILGFKAENFDNGILELDQVIISPEGIRYIGECEGKDNKAIDISKFRQLQDSLNEDFERDEIKVKAYGLLFGNPFRLTNPSQRENPFTDKCINGAIREKIGLISTPKLYLAAKYIVENQDENYKLECRSAIFNQLGQLVEFPIINTPRAGAIQ